MKQTLCLSILLKVFCLLLSSKSVRADGAETIETAPSHENHAQVAVTFSSSNLPIVVIDTHGKEIPDEPKITADMGIIDNGPGKRNYLTDPFNNYQGKIGIETRGSSTLQFPKKQFAVETRDSRGENQNVSLLGFPEENDWILYAPYTDKSLIRNVLAYSLASDLGRYASRTKFCELVLNGSYHGVYALMEKIKRDKKRVNISKIEPADVTGDAVTGGYIIKIDKQSGAGVDGWQSPHPPYPGAWQRIFFQYHDPDPGEIVPAQATYIQNYVAAFENQMNRSTYADPQNGYPKYIDIDSFVDFFIISEIGKNVDAYRLSTFLYKDRDSKKGKLTLGPVWDFNLAFGNVNYYNAEKISGWQVDFQQPDDYWQNPFWWPKLMADSNFVNKINARWRELRKNKFAVSRIYRMIDSLTTHLDEAQRRNFERWPILNTNVWPNAYVGGSYLAEIRYLKQWIQNRILWMDGRIPGHPPAGVAAKAENRLLNFTLAQNYPNPFNLATTIQYHLLGATRVSLRIFDLTGQEVRCLVDEFLPAGPHSSLWDGRNQSGQGVSSGVYIYQIQAEGAILNRKALLVK